MLLIKKRISQSLSGWHPVKVTNKDDGTSYEDPLELFNYLNKLVV
jgi:hypothetical protein